MEALSSISWEELERNPLLIEGVEGIVNLAGESINQLWTDAAKKTDPCLPDLKRHERLKRIMSGLPQRPNVWINASGVNAYGNSLTVLTEESPMNSVDFLSDVGLVAVRHSGAPAARHRWLLRIGIVLDQ